MGGNDSLFCADNHAKRVFEHKFNFHIARLGCLLLLMKMTSLCPLNTQHNKIIMCHYRKLALCRVLECFFGTLFAKCRKTPAKEKQRQRALCRQNLWRVLCTEYGTHQRFCRGKAAISSSVCMRKQSNRQVFQNLRRWVHGTYKFMMSQQWAKGHWMKRYCRDSLIWPLQKGYNDRITKTPYSFFS